MEKEISSGTMLGIVLIALAAVIGLGFGVFSIAKGVANEGTVGVQDNLAVVSESSFEDYNDKIVTGTQVKSAITTFTGKSVGILVHNTAMDKEVVTYKEHKSTQAYKLATNGQNDDFTDESFLSATPISGGAKIGSELAASDNAHYYINYNALFGSTASTADGVTTVAQNDGTTGTLMLKDGVYTASGVSFAVDAASGKVVFDNSLGGFGRTGNCEYIAATAKYDSNLIKDEAGTTIGIVFTQRAQ